MAETVGFEPNFVLIDFASFHILCWPEAKLRLVTTHESNEKNFKGS